MKKIYVKPFVETEKIDVILLAGSDRQVQGEAFTSSEIPTTVSTIDGWSHDNSGGQGEGGTGNRANSGLWED